MIVTVLVSLGGGIGSALRHGVNLFSARLFGLGFPWGTMAMNIIGSFFIVLLATYFAFRADAAWSQHKWLFPTTEILGGFIMFSTFSIDFSLLLELGSISSAVLYVTASVGILLAATFLGLFIGRVIG